jgi:hypothetical protein
VSQRQWDACLLEALSAVPLARNVKVEVKVILFQEFAIDESRLGAVGGELLLKSRWASCRSSAGHQSCSCREESHFLSTEG